MIKEKEKYYYKGKDPKNSFEFWVSKVEPDINRVLIVTDKGTEDAKVFTLSLNTVNDSVKENLIQKVI